MLIIGRSVWFCALVIRKRDFFQLGYYLLLERFIAVAKEVVTVVFGNGSPLEVLF